MGSKLPQHRSNPADPRSGSLHRAELGVRWHPTGLPVTWAVTRGSARVADSRGESQKPCRPLNPMPETQPMNRSCFEMVRQGRPLQTCVCLFMSGLLVLSACAPGAEPAPAEGIVEYRLEPLDVPSAESSGEPNLSLAGDRVLFSWLDSEGSQTRLQVAEVTATGIAGLSSAGGGDDLFVNWADVPATVQTGSGYRLAHLLRRGGQGTYDYAIELNGSADGGETWQPLGTVHDDGTPTEHGFVSLTADDRDGAAVLWLDGRRHVDGPEGPATGAMTLRWRPFAPDAGLGETQLVDERVCDCCQTGMVRTSDAWVAVYRDRSPDEVRDIHWARRADRDGQWQLHGAVADDGWVIAGCPVNGPALAARGDTVAVAWFSAPGDEPRVRFALSADGAQSFGSATRLDAGDPIGRVDLTFGSGGAVHALWIEQLDDAAALVLRSLRGDVWSPAQRLVDIDGGRASGFPRITYTPWGELLVAWTETRSDGSTQVRLARLVEVTA